MKFGDFVKVKSLQSPQGFKENLLRLGLPMPCDDVLESGPDSVMAQPLQVAPGKLATDLPFTPWKAGTVWQTVDHRTTPAGAGTASDALGPNSSGGVKPWRCAMTGAPTPGNW